MLSGNDQWPVFLERPRINQLRDILPRHPIPQLVPPSDGFGPVFVQCQRVAIVVLLQVGPYLIRVQFDFGNHPAACDLSLLDEDDRKPLAHHIVGRHSDGPNDAAERRGNHVLHLHRFDHGNLLPLPHCLVDADVDHNDRALDRRRNSRRSVRPGNLRRLFRVLHLSGLHLGIVRKKRQRITTLHASASESSRAGWRNDPLPQPGPARSQRHRVFIQPARMQRARNEVRVRQDRLQERNIASHPLQPEFAQRPRRPSHRRGE